MKLSRRQRLLIYKVSALLSLIRWYNIFFLALSQYLAVIFILNDQNNWLSTILEPDLHLIVFASLFCVAGGYIINNFYDLEKDMINRPNKTVYEKLVKQTTALRLYFLFNIIGVLLASMITFNVFLYFTAFVLALWMYSHKLKKITLVGNLTAALLSIMPFLAIFVYYHLEDLLVITYTCFILAIIFIREIIKDLETLKGDVLAGYNTLPVSIGVQRTKQLILLFSLVGAIPAIAIFIKTGLQGVSAYLFLGLTGVIASLAYLMKARKKEHYTFLNHLYRALIIGGIVSLVLVG